MRDQPYFQMFASPISLLPVDARLSGAGNRLLNQALPPKTLFAIKTTLAHNLPEDRHYIPSARRN